MTLYAEALATFDDLYAQAKGVGVPEPTAMTVATVDADGQPSARMVLLKDYGERGFVFYTHLDGRKGRELQAHPKAALLFFWKALGDDGVQVRIEGDVEIVDDAEVEAYFARRPRDSQLGAWASHQSETLDARETFERRFEDAKARFEGVDVPRPPRWGGFRVVPRKIEFWYGAQFRLHERHLYERGVDGVWTKRMLYP
ncbi:pyridoxamine 5'-phosphate oxidase [Lysobacter hankyongensis]|uniref:Pyridoxine/pyridoxamine 5'-phosphate oxidase n=1 Tax=Lysobacter hankyongensis TaxID=1176535 RepID=A0ABP9BCF4_9GAMM